MYTKKKKWLYVVFLPPGRSRELLGGKLLYDQRGDFDASHSGARHVVARHSGTLTKDIPKTFPRHSGARPAASCAQVELTACTRVAFLASDSGGTQVYDGDGNG